MALNLRQEVFVKEYLIDSNASRSALAAGYSPKTAYAQGHALLKHPEVMAALETAHGARLHKAGVTADRVVAELAKIGFSDLRRAVKWRSVPVEAGDDGVGVVYASQVTLVDSNDLDDDTAGAIQEISTTSQGGLKLKMYDKRAALVDLGKHLGMWKDDPTQTALTVSFLIEGLEPKGE